MMAGKVCQNSIYTFQNLAFGLKIWIIYFFDPYINAEILIYFFLDPYINEQLFSYLLIYLQKIFINRIIYVIRMKPNINSVPGVFYFQLCDVAKLTKNI
jgi:hypothetical protein